MPAVDPGFGRMIRGFMLVALLIVVGLVGFLISSDDMTPARIGGEDGLLGGEFTLTGIDGEVSLRDFRGKVVMLYFGFVNCSQVCPVSMRVMQSVAEKMSPKELAQLQVILISIDADQDSYAALAEYTSSFHPSFIGITGNVEQIDQVVDEYGAYFSPTELASTDPGKAFRHSSRYYIINQQGELVDAMRHGSTSNEILARIRTLI